MQDISAGAIASMAGKGIASSESRRRNRRHAALFVGLVAIISAAALYALEAGQGHLPANESVYSAISTLPAASSGGPRDTGPLSSNPTAEEFLEKSRYARDCVNLKQLQYALAVSDPRRGPGSADAETAESNLVYFTYVSVLLGMKAGLSRQASQAAHESLPDRFARYRNDPVAFERDLGMLNDAVKQCDEFIIRDMIRFPH